MRNEVTLYFPEVSFMEAAAFPKVWVLKDPKKQDEMAPVPSILPDPPCSSL